MTAPALPRLHAPYDWPAIDAAMSAGGGAILAGFVTGRELEELNAQIDRYLHQHQAAGEQPGRPQSGSIGYDRFLGHDTIRLHGLIEKLPLTAALIGHPDLLAWAARHMDPSQTAEPGSVLMNASELIQIQPGEDRQQAHRDSDSWPQAPAGDRPIIMNAIVALDPFTTRNGATYVAPGSWRWERSRRATAEEYARAVMDAGDAVLFRGDLIHRGGENGSDAPRRGISISYCAGWLRPVENSFLNLSPATVAGLSEPLRAALGYRAHDSSALGGGLLGLFENGDPANALPDGVS